MAALAQMTEAEKKKCSDSTYKEGRRSYLPLGMWYEAMAVAMAVVMPVAARHASIERVYVKKE